MKLNQVKAGAFLNLVSLMVSNLIPFVYTPIMLRLLGQSEYGLFGIANSFMGYLNLLNFGISGTIVRYISKCRALNDKQGEERMFGLFIKIYSVIGIAIMIAGTILAFNLGFYERSLTPDELSLLKKLVLIMTFNTAVFLPLSPFSAIVTAHEKFVFSKCLGMLISILSPIINIILLYHGFGSLGLMFCSTLSNIIGNVAYIFYVTKHLGIHPQFTKAPSGVLREIFGFSAFVFLGHVVDMLYWATDKLIIGWAVGAVGTAVYNIGASFNVYITSISTAISGVLMPRVTTMAVKDTPKDEFTNLFIKVGRLQFIIISFILSAFVAFGRQFIALWAGPGYEDAYVVALLTMIPVTIPLIQNTGLNILYAANKHKFRSIVYAVIAIANVVLTFWWVESYGIVGAAIATCIAYVIGNILIINWYYYKKIGIDIPLFWKNILKMSPVMFIMGTVWWFILDGVVFSGWMMFLGYAVIYTIIYCLLAYFFMLDQYEKDLLTGPVKKIFQKIRKR